ncbi:MAG: hypothetical protein QOJ09_231 [Actinomycetota bacterium]|nr:hypothetical protein [Actinomycetota bacterium]
MAETVVTMKRAFDWLFRSRETGRLTIAQLPNLPLGIFILALLVRRVLSPTGTARTAVMVVATGALLWWAVDEILRGESPFRRALGAVVLLATLARLLF